MKIRIGDIVKINTDSGSVLVSVVAMRSLSNGNVQLIGKDLADGDAMFAFSPENVGCIVYSEAIIENQESSCSSHGS